MFLAVETKLWAREFQAAAEGLTFSVHWSTQSKCRQLWKCRRILKKTEALFSDEEREGIVAMVSADPECGEVIQGTGGFRKVRVGRGGMGERGGPRVIYILRNERFPVFLVNVYAKNEKSDLTKAE